jgi:hypothetical protein
MNRNFELYLSLLVVFFLVFVYVVYELLTTPDGGHPFGHMLGIMGALLMLMTEILYSARKRWGLFKFGQVRQWLSFHIFTGIVGPALVLMHTGLEFRGLAGLTMLMTIIVVLSGFAGRYIYTAVPRTMAGMEVDRRSLEASSRQQSQELESWAADKSQRIQVLVQKETALAAKGQAVSWSDVFTRAIQEWNERRRLRAEIRRLNKAEQARMAEIERLLRRQQRLRRQIDSLSTVRRLMGWWHTLHVPLGLTLFSAMFIHIGATIYYGAL